MRRTEIRRFAAAPCTDHIALYKVHWPDPPVPIKDTGRPLLDLQREGRILAHGVSNYSHQQMDPWRRVAPSQSVQPPYNIFEREIDNDVLHFALTHAHVILAYGAICRGLPSGKITAGREFPTDDLRNIDSKFQ
jgi:aryl-alcohol dehydrogenase-like predicted oxidoreductase